MASFSAGQVNMGELLEDSPTLKSMAEKAGIGMSTAMEVMSQAMLDPAKVCSWFSICYIVLL